MGHSVVLEDARYTKDTFRKFIRHRKPGRLTHKCQVGVHCLAPGRGIQDKFLPCHNVPVEQCPGMVTTVTLPCPP
jgi:hypothetical protein